jgi:hypothetical protein
MKAYRLVLSLAFILLSSTTDFTKGGGMSFTHDYSLCCYLSTGVVEISPSGVAPVCQAGDEVELTCANTGEFHRWEVTVLIPQAMTTTVTVITSIGLRGGIRSVPINDATFSVSRLSGINDSMPLISRMTVSPVTSSLNGTVVNCFEGSTATDSVATTTIRIIDPGQFGKQTNKTFSVILSMGRSRGWGM